MNLNFSTLYWIMKKQSTHKKQVYRIILKSLAFIGLSALAFSLLRTALLSPAPTNHKKASTKPIIVDISQLSAGEIKTVHWNNQHIAILHRTVAMLEQVDIHNRNNKYFVFINQGGDVNCPLTTDTKTKHYLKDICSGYLYDSSGKVLKSNARVRNLSIPPHRLINKHQMLIGEINNTGT